MIIFRQCSIGCILPTVLFCSFLGFSVSAGENSITAAQHSGPLTGGLPEQEQAGGPEKDEASEFAARKTWELFRQSLKKGRLKAAYTCFSPRSRQSMSYLQFCGRYSPLSAATQLVLLSPTQTQCSYHDEKAILQHFVRLPKKARDIAVRIFLVREAETWFLVSEREWPTASLEADCRSFLKLCRQRLIEVATKGPMPASFLEFRMQERDFVATPLFQIVEGVYRVKIQSRGADNWQVRLIPNRPGVKLKGYQISQDGVVRSFDPEARND